MTFEEILAEIPHLTEEQRHILIEELAKSELKNQVDHPEEIPPTWTDEEIRAMIRIEPKTGAEIVAAGHTGGWEDLGIEDGVEWVEEQRRKRRANRRWS